MIAATVIAGGVSVVVVIRVVEWSFSPERRRRLAAKAHQRDMARRHARRRGARR
ncbi:MAG: hypothetical protein JWP31_1811 [Aeromicrobium sp.]|nr:hypothetical protein [Aeromicrobium sp.]